MSVNNTKYLLPFGILYLNAEVGGLSMRLKIKKKEKKKIKIKTTKAKKEKEKKNKRLLQLGFEPRSLAWKARIITTRLLYHMASK